MIYVVGPRDKKFTSNKPVIMTVSVAKDWGKGLSPFFLGPCELYNNFIAKNVENAWQFTRNLESIKKK